MSLQLKKLAVSGTMESSDAQITIEPNPAGGRIIHLQSVVKRQFGDAIKATVNAVLDEFDVADAIITIVDKGALDQIIRARMQVSICRAAEMNYDWSKEDK